MGKIICEICGTTYPDTAESCPICGYSQDLGLGNLAEEDILKDVPVQKEKGAAAVAAPEKKKAIFDYNEVNAEEEEEEDSSYDEEEEYEEAPRSNTVLVIILVVVIMLLLAATGFVFFRYYLPGMLQEEAAPTQTTAAVETETQTEETTLPTIPCESLVLTGGLDTLTMEGGNWLLHVVVAPADTTDELCFVSEDESVVTVDADGKLTAVGEGETYVNILCGDQKIQCHIVVDYSKATEATEETETIPALTHPDETEPEETQEETKPEETKPEETKPEEETKATEPSKETEPKEPDKEPQGQLKDVKLKLKKTDITLGVGYSYTIPLDCDLDYSEIEWSVEEPFIAKVENGKVTALMKGITDVVAKYGDQVVECRIRCS